MFPRIFLFSGLTLLGLVPHTEAHWPILRTAGLSARTEMKPVQRVFSVADLVVPIPSQPKDAFKPLPEEMDMKAWQEGRPNFRMPSALRETTKEDELIDLVTRTVAAHSWKEQGGPGTIQYYPLGMSLIINNTPQVLEEVSDLLSALRRLQDVEAKLRVMVLHVDPEHLEQSVRDLKLRPRLDKALVTPADKSSRVITPTGRAWSVSLPQRKTGAFFKFMQKSDTTTVMQSPAITLFNGQNGHVDIVEEKFFVTGVEIMEDLAFIPKSKGFAVGSRFALQPTVTAGRRAVRLDMEASLASQAGDPELTPVQIPLKVEGENAPRPFTIYLQKPRFTKIHVKPSLTIPDGDSVLLHCGVIPVDATKWRRHPLFEHLPLIGDWCMVSEKVREQRSVLIVVTPEVLVREEEEIER